MYKEDFHTVFEEHQEHPEYGPLMIKMKVKDANGESVMDEDQWIAASACSAVIPSTEVD
jgi:mRNA (guanine-N7-)-methyltransferase